MTAVQPALHPETTRISAHPPLRRRLSAALATAALVAAGLALGPVPPASAATLVTNMTELAAAFSAGGTVTLAAGFNTTGPGTIAVPANGIVTLDLNGQALTVTGVGHAAGIGVPVNASLPSTDTRPAGDGTVTATGGIEAAGIGGRDLGGAGGTVSVSGGTVIATGSEAAGIGGAYGGAGGTVTVSGGTVTATGGDQGAGIGGGNFGAGGTVSVSGGTVTATGGSTGAGIGGGSNGAGGTVSVSGGTVTATGGRNAAGIGGGSRGAGGAVTVTCGPTPGTCGAVTAQGSPSTPTLAIGAGGFSSIFGGLSNAGILTIPAGNTLTIPAGATVANSGMITLTGTIANAGSIVNTGTITPETRVAGNNYVVTFDQSHPSAPAPAPTQRVYASSLAAAQIPLPTPVRANYSFAGWHTVAPDGTRWDADTTITGDLTVFAQWTPTHTVTFDSNSGSPVTTNYNTVTAAPVVTPANTTPAQTLSAGDTVTVTGTGFAAGQQLQAWLHSDPVLLGTLTAAADGTATGQFTIPANTPAGVHHTVLVDETGTEHSSAAITITAAETPATPSPTPPAPNTPAPSATTGLAAMWTSPAWPLGLVAALLLAGVALAARHVHRSRSRTE